MNPKKIITLTTFLVLISCMSIGNQKFQQDKNAFEIYHESVSSLDSGNTSLALTKINQAIKLNPNFAQFYLQKGLIYYNLGEFDNALLSYKSAIEKRTNFIDPIIRIADIYRYEKKEFEQAAEYYKRAYKLDSSKSQYLLDAAHCFIEIKKLQDAQITIDEYRKESIINGLILPYDYYVQKSRLDILNEKYDNALKNIKNALRFSSQDNILLRMKVKCLFELNHIEEGIVIVSKLLAQKESEGDMYFYRGMYFYKKDNFNDAEKQFLRALEFGTSEKKVYKFLGELKQKVEPLKAMEYFLKYDSLIEEGDEKRSIRKKLKELANIVRNKGK